MGHLQIELLSKNHEKHIAVYFAHYEERLTELHETFPIKEFRYGVLDGGASGRNQMAIVNESKGYLEDRRPAAMMDPYLVCVAEVETTCGRSH